MGSILIDKIRIKGFRGLNNIELSLQDTTILTGANNAGKTSVLKALQLALGNRAFLTIDDFNISNNIRTDSIIVDIRIIPVDVNNNRAENFDENWEACFTEKSILMDASGFAYVPIRTIYTNNLARGDFDKTQRILKLWESDTSEWYDIECSKNKPNLDSIPFFYIEAQRDVVEDLKVKNSFLGRMLSQITESYSDQDVKTIEGLIEDLNQKAIDSSNVLSIIQSVLSGIDSTIDNDESSVKLTPFAKKIRDLNKSISIQYGEKDHSFSMEYHGMGTRSWSSLLAFKAFIKNIVALSSEDSDSPLYPIIAIEEPEAHLHPNAQKKLYAQIHDMPGQKIVSTHSPYIAASAELGQLRNLYKSEQPTIGELSISSLNKEELRKIKQKVVNTKGEIIFSKVLVLFEGETEEQALPIFATHYWNRHPSQLGIDFVSVGGAGQYYPFLKFAHDFKIPVFIFSDGEDKPIKEITKAIFKVYGSEQPLSNYENVIIIPNGCDFEAMLLKEGYQDQIIEALKSIKGDYVLEDYIRKNEGKKKSPHKTDRICKTCNQPIYEAQFANAKIKIEKMKNINFNIDIPQDNPFQFDKLHRQPSIEMFTNIISGFSQGCVCSINAPWGMGKTQFVKMLQMKLNQDGHRTFFFNAWESDYSEDPITAIISEMSISKQNKNIWGLMGRLVIGVGKELGKGALHKISGIECDSVFDALADWSKKKVEDYENQKATIEQFKQLLSEEIASTSSKLPVIFFVDELDRCNPIFAVRTLERIKHIFDIPNIVFILSIDKKQLENSICGYFGTDKFDAEEYLRRFIDIEYQLPEPSYDSYIDHIAHNVGIEQDLRMEGSLAYEDFKRILSFQVASEHLSLRQIEKLLIHVSIITSSFSTGALMEYIAFFVYLSFFKCEILNKIENKQYNDVAELLQDIQTLCPKADDDYSFFIGKILGLYGDYIGCLDLKNPDSWLPKNNLYFSEDAAMQLIPGMKQIVQADYSHKIKLEEILRHIHLYSRITKF